MRSRLMGSFFLWLQNQLYFSFCVSAALWDNIQRMLVLTFVCFFVFVFFLEFCNFNVLSKISVYRVLHGAEPFLDHIGFRTFGCELHSEPKGFSLDRCGKTWWKWIMRTRWRIAGIHVEILLFSGTQNSSQDDAFGSPTVAQMFDVRIVLSINVNQSVIARCPVYLNYLG